MSYATLAEARAEGVPTTISDQRLQAALDAATALIDEMTRQFFEVRSLTLDIDGSDGHLLHLPVPVITISAIYLNGEFQSASTLSRFRVYNGRAAPNDHRKNPKIAMAIANNSIYEIPRLNDRGPVFMKGYQNQRIVGTFGYVEPDNSTPVLIKRACLKIALTNLSRSPGGMWGSIMDPVPVSNQVQSETTDGHTITYGAAASSARAGALTGDAEVDYILRMYRGPMHIRVPGSVYTFKG